MYDGMFVFDSVIHVVDYSPDHMKADVAWRDPELVAEMIRLSKVLTGGVFDVDWRDDSHSPAIRGNLGANYDVMFGNAPTDMAVVGSLPFGPGTASDLYEDPEYFIKLNHGFVEAYSDRCLFSGGVEPGLHDVGYALETIEYQATELGARLMKFYPFQWRCDDEKIAYPMYEKCREVGLNTIQFHLCLPGDSSHDVEIQRPNYLQRVARDFPDMQIIMHHPMPLYFEETVNIVARFRNIHLTISPMLQLSLQKPRLIHKMMGELLQSVGSSRLLYGTEGAMSGDPTRYVKALAEFDIPEDIQSGYGFPQITRHDKERILGLNLADLLGVDVEAKKRELTLSDMGRNSVDS